MNGKTVGFIGGGRITRVFLGGWTRAGKMPARVVVGDADAAVLARLKQDYGTVDIAAENSAAAAQDVVFVALHPPVIADALGQVKSFVKPNAIIVSLAPKLMFVAATCVVLIVKAISPVPGMASSSSADGTAAAPGGGDAPTLAMRDGVKVYYLHGNIRCPTCRTIESTAQEAVETGFTDQLQSGQLQWQVINYETSGNEHYATDFEVVAPSVVLVKNAGGQQTAWKSLPEVWELGGDKPAFIRFMQDSLRAFIGASPSNSAGVSNVLRSPSESESWPLPIPE